jgi:glycosyltransferase involved in cell wall biosynthesis
MPKKPSIAWITNDWASNDIRRANDLYGGIGYYRAVAPSRSLRKWFDIELIGADFQHWGTTDETYSRLGKDYDLIICKHISDGQTASNILATGKHFKKKVLVDIDDNFFAVRKDSPAFKDYDKGQQGRYYIGALLELADGMTVSTDPLKEVYSKLNKSIDVLPNCVELEEWPIQRKVWDDGKIRIGFSGGVEHKVDLEMILEPMSYILAKHPNVLFEICAAVSPQTAMEMGVKMNEFCKKDITKQFRITGGTEGATWLGYPQLLNSFGWDIIIAPLIEDEFNRGKSHIRWLESTMVGCPVVASPVYPYIESINGVKTIEDGKTGFFAHNNEQWYQKLEDLIQSKELRQTINSNAYEYIKKHWQQKQCAKEWKKVIEKYL